MARLLARIGWWLVDRFDPIDCGPDPWGPGARWYRQVLREPQGYYCVEDPATKTTYKIPTYIPKDLARRATEQV